MKEYDLIVIGTGSAMNVVDAMIGENPKLKVAVIDKDEPGGICLTRGCIPSKILLYPAELIRTIERAGEFGITAEVKSIDFEAVMDRMRKLINKGIDEIRDGLSNSKNIDYYHSAAEFIAPYTMKVGGETIEAKMIFLSIGSETIIPSIKGLEKAGYLTSDTILNLRRLPKSVILIGGGYIAAEYGHFLSSMGSKVTIVGRNKQFLPEEEPEISAVAKKVLEAHITILTNHEVTEVQGTNGKGKKIVIAFDRTAQKTKKMEVDEVMIASGRGPTSDILHPERAGIKTNEKGWIWVNEYLETSQPNVWAIGDADGIHMFKHVANYESQIVYYNAVRKKRVKVDYHAVPHAVFTYPEVAAVGLREVEAAKQYGEDGILIGYYKFEDTAKGEAMNVKDYFVKVIAQRDGLKLLGAHIVGPYASVLIQEIVNVMNTPHRSARTINEAIHIHPALAEVVDRAVGSLMPPEQYHHLLEHSFGHPSSHDG